jgi:hypothetical protein
VDGVHSAVHTDFSRQWGQFCLWAARDSGFDVGEHGVHLPVQLLADIRKIYEWTAIRAKPGAKCVHDFSAHFVAEPR